MTPRRVIAGWLAAAAWLVAASQALAHKPSDAYLQLRVDGAVIEQRFDIALRDLERDLALDADENGELDWREVRTRWSDIDALARQALTVQADGQPCRAGPPGRAQLEDHSDGRYAVLTRQLSCAQPVRTLSIDYRLFQQTDPTHRGIVRVQHAGRTDAAVLTPGAPAQTFSIATAGGSSAVTGVGAAAGSAAAHSLLSGFLGFVPEGVHHILVGSDHILFLLALLLPALLVRRQAAAPMNVTLASDGSATMGRMQAGPGGDWLPAPALKPVLLDVLRVVTAFTVAHSITLALAAFDLVNPPSRAVESIIAASVVLAALNNLLPVFREGRWKLTFVFGLVHGFGFASALKDLGLVQGALVGPLLGFNVGVELGQLTIVAVFISAAWKLRATRFYRRGLLTIGSIAIALLAAGWLVERAFDVKLPLPL